MHDTDTQPNNYSVPKENYRKVSLMHTDAKIVNKILASRTQHHIKKIIP